MSIEQNTASVSDFYKRVRTFASQTPVWGTALRYQTMPDERWDMTLVSQRVYGRRDEFLAVMAAAGLDSIEQQLTEQLLVLPTEAQLKDIKTAAGFVNLADDRPVTSPTAIPPEYALLLGSLTNGTS
ncbi:hypothetical protein [Cupriavidus basilensis]|uniref:Uncharacterized protein n=1 Tax=Cupriavidus basilensis TaxID=68895 RepID=A0A0C4YDJ8_9BURK|nr:hypothetical protein [Cupriavidus basilensis]AJG18826.1 hypothetical protein RR42_m1425 [Cupriavidus basilensis]